MNFPVLTLRHLDTLYILMFRSHHLHLQVNCQGTTWVWISAEREAPCRADEASIGDLGRTPFCLAASFERATHQSQSGWSHRIRLQDRWRWPGNTGIGNGKFRLFFLYYIFVQNSQKLHIFH